MHIELKSYHQDDHSKNLYLVTLDDFNDFRSSFTLTKYNKEKMIGSIKNDNLIAIPIEKN